MTDLSSDRPVGFVAATSAAVVMAGILGVSQASTMTSQVNTGSSTQQNGAGVAGTAVGTDVLTSHLAGMSRHQLYQIVSQMKDLIHQNQQQARQILIANPQLTKALFQAQIMLGMVRPPLTSPLQNVAAQAPQQQLVQQPPIQAGQMQAAAQPPQSHNLSQPPSMQQSPVQQGQPQMPTGQLQQPLLQGTQQSPAPRATPQSHQPLQLQHSLQTLQQPSTLTATMLPPSQPAPPATINLGLQPQNPAMQHGQPQPPLHLHPPPLPQQPRPLVPPSQLQHPNVQGLSFPLPHPQSHLSQSPFQQPGGMPQNNIGLPYQSMHPPLPNQPPPQMFQVPRSGADVGTSIGQGGLPNSAGVLTGAVSMSMGGPSQAVRGSSLGVPSGLAPHMTWNQPLTASGSMVGVTQATTSMGMGPGHPLGGGSVSLAGFSSNGAPIQQGAVRSTVASEGLLSMYSQGYTQPLTQPQQQSQQQPQIQVPLELEQQKALLQQVMNLTSEQINSLPLEQRQQVLQLQQVIRSQTS